MVSSWDVIRAWGLIRQGRKPALSIEITKECPLHCPGCYAFDENHLGAGATLKQLSDLKGDALVAGVLDLVERRRPLHVSLVGGDPLVRYRELERLVPQLLARGIFTQVVTSAFRPLPQDWPALEGLEIVVSIDGLRPEHDVRRAPATYDRIIANIRGHHVVVHCTLTGLMLGRPGYIAEFVDYWSANNDVKKIWMSIFTPQRGADLPEIPSPAQRESAIADMLELRLRYPKFDMRPGTLQAFRRPPADPGDCVFAQVTETVSADLHTLITPCQFGGDPDCSRCGCIASMGLAAIERHRLPGGVAVGPIFRRALAAGIRRRERRARRHRAATTA